MDPGLRRDDIVDVGWVKHRPKKPILAPKILQRPHPLPHQGGGAALCLWLDPAPRVERNLPLDGGGRRGWSHKHLPQDSPPKILIPTPNPFPHTLTHSRHTRGPDAGPGGEAGDGGARLAGQKVGNHACNTACLIPDPVRKLQIRDGRPLVRSMSTLLGPKAAHHPCLPKTAVRRRFCTSGPCIGSDGEAMRTACPPFSGRCGSWGLPS